MTTTQDRSPDARPDEGFGDHGTDGPTGEGLAAEGLTATPAGRRFVPRSWHLFVVFAALATAATLTSAPGVWIADARLEFSADPTRFLAGHGHLWDARRGLGNPATWYSPVLAIFEAALQQLGANPWLIERLVHAALLTVAASGVVMLLRVTTPRVGALHLLAGLIYAFNPYTSQYLVPSGLFLSYALAPWLLACFLRGIRERDDDWRMAAGFALCIFAHGALNSAALLYALVPIAIAAAYVVIAERSIQLRLVLGWLLRAAILSVLVASGALLVLWFQRGDVALNLATTEQQSVVSSRSSWAESWRGLGFWLTYFQDAGGPLRPQAASYFQNWFVAIAAYGAPLAAGVTLTLSRWRPRWFYGALVATGVVVMVGVWPPSAPSPLGRVLNWGFEHVLLLRGLRTTYKSGSVASLGIATLAAYGIVRLIRMRASGSGRLARRGPAIAGWGLFGLVALSAYPFWTGNVYSADDGYDEIPAYWDEAIDWINAQPEDGRVLVLPGVIRTPYRWGYVNDNLFHGLLDKSLVMLQSVPPPGTPLTAELVIALDDYLSSPEYREGTVGPILRRLGVRWIVFQNDVDWQRVGVPRPAHFDALRRDRDLVLANSFGEPGENTSVPFDIVAPLVGETEMLPVEVFEVRDTDDTIRVSTERPVVVVGAGDAWLQLADQGLLDAGPVAYTGTLDNVDLGAALIDGSAVVVTDGSRRRYLQVAGGLISHSHTLSLEETTPRPARSPFESTDSTSVAVYAEATSIEASTTGDGSTPFDPAQRPALAFDGVAHTAWEVSGAGAEGAVLTVRLRFATPIDGLAVQTTTGQRSIGRITVDLITATGSDVTATEEVDPRGKAEFDLDAADVTEIRLRIEQLGPSAISAAGIADVVVISGDRELDLREFIRVPVDLQHAAQSDPALAELLATSDISYSFQRRTGSRERDEETEMRREFWSPGDATVDAVGSLQITAATPDITVDRLVGAPIGAFASSRAPGFGDAWGLNAVDGDPTTSWLGTATAGESLTVRPPPRTIGSIEFVVTLAEDVTGDVTEFSSIDTATITATAAGETVTFNVEADDRACALRADGLRACTSSISAEFPADVYDTIRLELTGVSPIETAFGTRPVAVNEVVFDGESILPDDLRVDRGQCIEGFALDGRSVPMRMLGTRAELLERRVIHVESCEPVKLAEGDHRLVSTPRWSGAIADLLIAASGEREFDRRAQTASVEVIERSPTRIVLDVTAPAGSLLIGPGSFHAGWRASIDGTTLGKAVPRDTLSAWRVPALESTRVELSFRPQRAYELALAMSAAGVAICLVLLVLEAAVKSRRIVLAVAGFVFGFAVFGPALAVVGLVLGALMARRQALGAAVAAAALVAAALYANSEAQADVSRFADFVGDRPLANHAARLAWLAWTLAVAAGWMATRARDTSAGAAAGYDDRTPLVATESRSVPLPVESVAVVGTIVAIACLLVLGDRTWAWLSLPIAVGTAVLLAAVHLPRMLRSDWTAIVRLLPGGAADEQRTDDVVHGSVWMLGGTAAVAIGSFAFWIVAARTATQESVGAAAALFSVVTFLNYASSLGLPIALSRMSGDGSSVLFTWMLAITTLSSFVAVLVFAAVAPGSIDAAIGGAGLLGWLVVALMVAGMSLSVLVDVRCMTLRLWRWVFWRSVAISVVRVPFLFLVPDGNATLYLFALIAGAYAVTGVAVLAALLLRSKERFRTGPAPSDWRRTARFAIVNYAGQLAIQAPFFVVPIIVLTSLSAEENASFYVAWGIMSVVVISVQLVGQVLLVEGGRGPARGGQARVALAVAMAVSVLSLAAVVVLASVIRAVYGAGYEDVSVLLVLLIGGTVPYSATVVGLNATRVSMDNRSTIVITFAFAALVLLPALVLTNGNGATGAAWAWLLGNCAAAVVVLGIHRRQVARWLRPSLATDAPDRAVLAEARSES